MQEGSETPTISERHPYHFKGAIAHNKGSSRSSCAGRSFHVGILLPGLSELMEGISIEEDRATA